MVIESNKDDQNALGQKSRKTLVPGSSPGVCPRSTNCYP